MAKKNKCFKIISMEDYEQVQAKFGVDFSLAQCKVGEIVYEVCFTSEGINVFAHSLYGDKCQMVIKVGEISGSLNVSNISISATKN